VRAISLAARCAALTLLGACASASRTTEEGAPAPSSDGAVTAVPSQLPLKYVGPRTRPVISAADMMTRLYVIADDSMMGRSAATPYNAKGALYIEREVRRLGLQPAGENGTYFQFPLDQRELDPTTSLSVAGKTVALWTEFAPRDQGPGGRAFDGATVIYAGSLGAPQKLLPPSAVAGRIALVTAAKDSAGRGNFNVNRLQLTTHFPDAAGIAVVTMDYMPPGYVEQFRGTAQVLPKGIVFTCLSYDVDPRDFTDPGSPAIVSATLAAVRPGSIVSLHCGHEGTVAAIAPLLAGLHARKLRPVTCSELFA